MTTYLVRLQGQNFLMDGGQGPRMMRFRSTRLVNAEHPGRAEILARNLIRNDTRLKNGELNEESAPPLIRIESVSEVSAAAYDAQNRAHSYY
jgi:hypothetical protein